MHVTQHFSRQYFPIAESEGSQCKPSGHVSVSVNQTELGSLLSWRDLSFSRARGIFFSFSTGSGYFARSDRVKNIDHNIFLLERRNVYIKLEKELSNRDRFKYACILKKSLIFQGVFYFSDGLGRRLLVNSSSLLPPENIIRFKGNDHTSVAFLFLVSGR